MTSTPALQPHPDRLFPADPELRKLTRRLYEAVRDAPIVSPHGHVPAQWLLDDAPFADPTSLLLQPDHYVTRLLHASGVSLAELGVGEGPLPEARARRAWRLLCEHWPVFRGTPVRYWFDTELADLFGVTVRPSAGTADDIYDRIADCLTRPEFRPRALLRRFGIEVLATTDDPVDGLAAHAALAAEPDVTTRVLPTFRPDRYLEPLSVGWASGVDALGAAADVETDTYDGYLEALAQRRRYFVEHGAVSADHSHVDLGTEPLPLAEARRIFTAARAQSVSVDEAVAFRRNMMLEMARMSVEDGLVMTVHPAIYRNHHPDTLAAFGADTGHDIPVQAEFTRALHPLLQRFGMAAGFHLVLFTVDATVYSREIAPLAGFYPSVYVGVPWWFLDSPAGIRSFHESVTEIAGFSRLSGFIDDTRAFCSIPARHDMARRLDAGHLARLVAEHRLDEDEAFDTIGDLVDANPRHVFKL